MFKKPPFSFALPAFLNHACLRTLRLFARYFKALINLARIVCCSSPIHQMSGERKRTSQGALIKRVFNQALCAFSIYTIYRVGIVCSRFISSVGRYRPAFTYVLYLIKASSFSVLVSSIGNDHNQGVSLHFMTARLLLRLHFFLIFFCRLTTIYQDWERSKNVSCWEKISE